MGRKAPSRVRIPPSPLPAPARGRRLHSCIAAPVAQLDRASVYGTEGQRFESSRARWVGLLQEPAIVAESTTRPLRQERVRQLHCCGAGEMVAASARNLCRATSQGGHMADRMLMV